MTHFVPRQKAGLRSSTWYGGGPAGQWDVDTLVAFSKDQEDLPIHYTPHNIYDSPIPDNLGEPFEAKTSADVVSSFMGGLYRNQIAEGRLADLSELWAEEGWDKAFPAVFRRMAS